MANHKLLAKNKKAYFDFEILETFEAGIVLTGAEVKSLKAGAINLRGSFISMGAVPVTENLHISAYQPANQANYNPTRRRTLLLHKEELSRLHGLEKEKGLTIIPLEVYLKNGFAKMLIGVCRGRKKHDKRNVLKKRVQDREIKRALSL